MRTNGILCLITDFGNRDRFTGIMKGVACRIDPNLKIFDLTHEVPPFQISDASYILADTVRFWPSGTVFVAIVDPGVGSERLPLVAEINTGHYVVCPDNGLLTVIKENYGIKKLRRINTSLHRLPGFPLSTTFHGRDIFIFVGAKLASGKIDFADTGFLYNKPVILFSFPSPEAKPGMVTGVITRVEEPFGNICTNISNRLMEEAGIKSGCSCTYRILRNLLAIESGSISFVETFSDVRAGNVLAYIDSDGRLGLARNQAPFKKREDILGGRDLLELKMNETAESG